jgi:hypothetical protein
LLLQSSPSSEGGWLAHHLLMSALIPVKPSRLTKAEKLKFNLTEDIKNILVGLMLGDLYINKQGINPRLCFKQCEAHKDYLDNLYELFSSYCCKPPKTINLPPDPRTGKVYKSVYFYTYSLPCFAEIYNLFYVNGKKVVPSNIAELLTPSGLAYWICDDGSPKASGGLTLCTNSFSVKEVSLLVDILTTQFGLIVTIHTTEKGHKVIYISKKSMDKLRSIVKPHIVPSMLYKIHS